MNEKFEKFYSHIARYTDSSKNEHVQFWRIAQQLQLRDMDHVFSILHDLDGKSEDYRARQLTQMRKLGLVRSLTETNLMVTAAGRRFLDATTESHRQAVVDQQLLKLWLYPISQTPFDVYPTAKLLEILCHIQSISFVEYISIVIWVQQDDSAEYISALISDYRQLSLDERKEILKLSENLVSTDAWTSYLARLYKMFKLGSYFSDVPVLEEGLPGGIRLAIPVPVAKSLVDLVSTRRPLVPAGYETWLETSDFEIDTVLTNEINLREGVSQLEATPTVAIEADAMFSHVSFRRPEQRGLREHFPNWGDDGLRPAADYLAKAESAGKAGRRAEVVVFEFEKQRLHDEGMARLADLVAHVAETTDSLSYDVHSFHADGVERHIEVKSITVSGAKAAIHITYSELLRAQVDLNYELFLVEGAGTSNPRVIVANSLLRELIAFLPAMPVEGNTFVATPESWVIDFGIEILES